MKADDPKTSKGESKNTERDLPEAEAKAGAATPLQPGGTKPGGSPGASVGSIGTGGGSTAGEPTGNAAKPRR